MIKCVIIDDEQPAINVIESYINQLPNLQLVGTATNPLIGIDLVKQHHAELVFLDIQMDEMNGIDVMKIISPEAKVIFCTAYSEFAVASYDLDAVDYLVKPIPFNRFVKAVQKASNLINKQTEILPMQIPHDYIFVKTEQKGKLIKIDFDDIDYIEGMSNYIAFHCGSRKTLAYLTMKEMEETLPANQFMRVHKSYIIALKQVAQIENGEICLKNRKEKIPLSGTYKETFFTKTQNNG